MAITISDTEPRVQYTATSGQTSFSVPFEFFTVNDIKVYNGTTLLSYNASPSSASQYSVTGAGVSGGGSITLGGGATLNDKITIYRDLAIARSTDFPTSGAFQISSLNDELDKIIAMCQQLERDLKFSPRAASTTASTYNLTFPELVANKFLTVNTAGTALEFTQDVTNVNTVAGIASDITTVSGIAANVTTVAGVHANVTTVANNITSVNTVANNIADIVTVANDLNEAVSEIETVASDLQEASPEIDTVAAAITNVDNVGNNIANVNTVAGSISNVNSVAGNATNINTVAAANSNITTLAGINANITTVAGIASNVTSVANDATDIGTVATNIGSVNSVATNISNINAVNSNATNINAVAADASDIGTVAGMESNINSVVSNATNINTVAGSISNVNSVGGSIANVNTVATNLSGVNSFAERYRVASSAPASSNDVGDLYFDTTANELKVYKSSGWAAAGSTVNGTSRRYTYNITGTPTTVSGADAKGETLAYDAGFVDVYLNGVRLSNTSGSYTGDVTVSSGTSVVFANALSAGDVVDIVAYGTFSAANIDAGDITTGTLNNARLSSVPNSALANSSITINGSAVSLGGSVTVGETKPTITSCTPNTITNDATNVVIAGTNFVSVPQVEALNPSTGIWYPANSITFTSATSITANFTLTVDAQYKIRIENPDGNSVLSSSNVLTVSDAPSWTTAAGSLGTIAGNFSGTVTTVAATSDSAITYSETTNVLTNASQANCALNSSSGAITTTDFGGSSTSPTTYNFTIRATDAEGQYTDRSFSLTSSYGATGGGQFN